MAVSKRDKDAHMSVLTKVKEKDFILDAALWRLVEMDGLPIAALYFNGREFSLSQEAMEGLTNLILEYMQPTDDYIDQAALGASDSGCGHDHT